jgi:TPP-dependent pyruvate/acetoin dehydrogenase alpha subunit
MSLEYNGHTKETLVQFENDLINEFKLGHIRFPCHFSAGNETQLISIFKENNIGMNDWVFSTHRSHLHSLLKGIPKEWLKEQILKGNSMHIMSKEYKFFSSSIVGGSLPIAVGTALAIKRNGSNERVFAFCGDMASTVGLFHECLSYAIGFQLPIKFIIEDNGFSTNSLTWETWGTLPLDLIQSTFYLKHQNNKYIQFYKYERTCPHINVGTHVVFN